MILHLLYSCLQSGIISMKSPVAMEGAHTLIVASASSSQSNLTTVPVSLVKGNNSHVHHFINVTAFLFLIKIIYIYYLICCIYQLQFTFQCFILYNFDFLKCVICTDVGFELCFIHFLMSNVSELLSFFLFLESIYIFPHYYYIGWICIETKTNQQKYYFQK